MSVDARTEIFEEVTVLGIPMIFTCCRVKRDTVPEGFYVYDVRHDDECQGLPVELGKWIMVNHWGTVISNVPVELQQSERVDNAYLDIDPEEDWNYEGAELTLDEYIREHPPINQMEDGNA